MDIQKAQRLSQYLGIICDMVEYEDIGPSLQRSGLLSEAENQQLCANLRSIGNFMVMHELLTMLNLRRGGFDVLLSALREADYAWVAEQLDPGNAITGAQFEGYQDRSRQKHGLMSNVRQRISRKSDPIPLAASCDPGRDIIFTSYRDSCPMDIPLNPSYYSDTSKVHNFPITANDLLCQNVGKQNAGDCAGGTSHTSTSETTSLLKKFNLNADKEKQALVYNVAPDQLKNGKQYFSDLAKRVNIPSPMIKGLKVIECGKVSKVRKKKTSKHAVKLKFQSQGARNTFVENLKHFIATLEPNHDLYGSVGQLEVKVPNPSNGLKKKAEGSQTFETSSKQVEICHWYQRPFKAWKK